MKREFIVKRSKLEKALDQLITEADNYLPPTPRPSNKEFLHWDLHSKQLNVLELEIEQSINIPRGSLLNKKLAIYLLKQEIS